MAKKGARMTGVGSLINALDDIEERWVGSVAWEVGTNVEYSIHVEYGTGRMNAQPYLRPAVQHAKRNLDRWAKQADGIQELIETVALEIERYAKEVVPVDTGTLRASIKAQPASGDGKTLSKEISV